MAAECGPEQVYPTHINRSEALRWTRRSPWRGGAAGRVDIDTVGDDFDRCVRCCREHRRADRNA